MTENSGSNWHAALVRFLDALTELAKIGNAALKEELAKKEAKEKGLPFIPPHLR